MAQDDMSDSKFIASLRRVTSPKVALRLIVDKQDFLGYDPYFADLRQALLDMADRLATKRNRCTIMNMQNEHRNH